MGKLCGFLRSRLEVTDDPGKVCNEVVDTCLYKGSRDNMSAILICFPNAPKVSAETAKKEAELDKYLEYSFSKKKRNFAIIYISSYIQFS
uniref:Protein serine/threonine phosphatase 2C C-terminal domain-containing protein n=1 Tax=Theropithecus gelada TaxID=9565 RepID=A0A8D2FT67_THEGE